MEEHEEEEEQEEKEEDEEEEGPPRKILRRHQREDLIKALFAATDIPTIESILSLGFSLGIDINTLYDGDTVLSKNIERGNVDIVNFLLQKGVDINQKVHHDQTTPLSYACECNNPEIVNMLIKAGADVNETDNFEYAPLHIACITETGENQSIIHMLVDAGADINAVTKNKYTPLTLACKYSNPRCVLYLSRIPRIILFIVGKIHPIVALCKTISDVYKKDRDMSEFWLQKFFMLSEVLNGIPYMPITIGVLNKAIQNIKRINNPEEEGMIQEEGMTPELKDDFITILEKRKLLEERFALAVAPVGGKRTRRISYKRSKTRRISYKRSKTRRNSYKRSKRRI